MAANKEVFRIDKDTLERLRQIDLLTYMQLYERDNLVRTGANTYKTRDHDSLKISNGKWYWWSRGFGGVSALDYLIKVRDMSFLDAVKLLFSGGKIEYLRADRKEKAEKMQAKRLKLPLRNRNCNRVMRYLTGRGIDEELIRECIRTGMIYESADHHNAVFIGKDRNGIPKYAACRGTMTGSMFKGDISGSDKHFSFRLASGKANSVHLFEAAIDLLSYATYLKCEGVDYHKENLLSLSGVYQPSQSGEITIPIALDEFLKQHTHIKTIYLHLDNDKAGQLSTQAIYDALKSKYQIIISFPSAGKDVNDFLREYLKNKDDSKHKEKKIVSDVCMER